MSLLLGSVVLTASLAAIVIPALANLTGSTFEGNDGNLVVNTTGNTDWENAPNRVVGVDQPSGSTDNAFGQGTKEDKANVTVVDGSIPPNQNDLTRFYVGSEFASGSNYLYLGWERAVNIGNANMDFEINQKATSGFTGTTTGPVTLNRTAGDLLVTYDFSGSGTPTLGLLTWVTSGSTSQCFSSNSLPCWGNRVDLSAAGFAEGAVNSGTVTDPINPGAPRTLTTGLFGEAAINLTAAGVFPAGTCKAFGSTFLKSRSSSSFGAELKDFIAPQPVNISNCGEVKIIKHTDPRGIGQNFGYTSTIPGNTSFTLNDNGNTTGDSAGNTKDITNVAAGSYTVTEGSEPANFGLESLTCTATGTGASGTQHAPGSPQADITVTAGSVVACTYTNQQQLGAIKITKTSSKAAATPLAGAKFSITSGGTAISGSPFTTGSDGTVCVGNLPYGTYSVQETTAPTGYSIDDTTAHDVTVNANSTCGDGNEATFLATDTPKTDLTITATSEVSGGTKSSIQCTTGGPTGFPGTDIGNSPVGIPTPVDPANVTANGLKPGTYTCKVVIDP
jgi:hypothetical protein